MNGWVQGVTDLILGGVLFLTVFCVALMLTEGK